MGAHIFQIIGLVCLASVQIYGQTTSSFSSTMSISASDTSISSASLYQNSTNTISSPSSYAASVVTSNSETVGSTGTANTSSTPSTAMMYSSVATSMIQNSASQTGFPSSYGTSAVTSNSETVVSTGAANTSSTPSASMISSSIASSMIQSSSSASYAASVVTSNSGTVGSTGASTASSTPSASMMSSSVATSMIQNSASQTGISSSVTSISSSSITSASITTVSINTSISLVYQYIVSSSSVLAAGNTTNSTYLTSVQSMVIGSFNLTRFNIIVTRIEIQATAKTVTTQYTLFTDILFTSSRSDCNSTCIKSSASSSISKQNIILPGADGSSVTVSLVSGAAFVDNTPSAIPTTTVARIVGESPPGTAAQLGMGLGISFIGIILTIEIVYLYRKYGCNQSTREADYALATYNHRL
ncbi:unnamed protein product [Rotaria socialis]|uniref:Uncharacterized protein n=1 Tax=Rotaria socialis TaxID=392032 RepID=A0A821N6C2_9BILA|nr:unnamed protein product [Rotaria socialis]